MDDSSKLCVPKTSRITIYYVSLTIYKQNDGEGRLKKHRSGFIRMKIH